MKDLRRRFGCRQRAQARGAKSQTGNCSTRRRVDCWRRRCVESKHRERGIFNPSSGQFVLTGIMESGRAGISAAPLSPTQVLLAGGFSGVATIKNFSLNLDGKILSSAESFDETTAYSRRPPRWARHGWLHRDRVE